MYFLFNRGIQAIPERSLRVLFFLRRELGNHAPIVDPSLNQLLYQTRDQLLDQLNQFKSPNSHNARINHCNRLFGASHGASLVSILNLNIKKIGICGTDQRM